MWHLEYRYHCDGAPRLCSASTGLYGPRLCLLHRVRERVTKDKEKEVELNVWRTGLAQKMKDSVLHTNRSARILPGQILADYPISRGACRLWTKLILVTFFDQLVLADSTDQILPQGSPSFYFLFFLENRKCLINSCFFFMRCLTSLLFNVVRSFLSNPHWPSRR